MALKPEAGARPAPRELRFSTIDAIMPEVDRLLDGHATLGRWSLGQICEHLALSFRLALGGPVSRASWVFRRTIGPILLRGVLVSGRMPSGVKSPRELIPAPGSDAREEAARLGAAIAALRAHPGPFAEHPIGGYLGRSGWDRLHRIHCAHHLRLVLPRDDRREGL